MIQTLLKIATACFLTFPAWAKELPIKDFARLPQYTQAKISPTGEYLAVTVPSDDQTGLAIIRLADMKLTGGARGGRNTHVANFWWVNAQRVVVTLAESSGFLEAPSLTGQLMGINADGSNKTYLYGYKGGSGLASAMTRGTTEYGYAEMVSPLRHDPDHVLIAVRHLYDLSDDKATATVYQLDVMTGKTRGVARAPQSGGVNFLADDLGAVRYAVGQDEGSLVDHTFVRNPATDQWAEIGKPKKERSIIPLRITSDNRTVYLRARDGTDAYCLTAQELATGQSKNLSCHSAADLERVLFSADGDTPIAAMFEPGKLEITWLNESHPDTKLLASLAASFPGQTVLPTSWTDDGSKLVLVVYSDRNPGEFFLYDRKTGKAKFLLAVREWIDPQQMAEVRPISFKSRDGSILYGYLTLPPGRVPSKLPVIVMPHGGPFGVRDSWGWDADAQLFASRGYGVLQVNFRGSGGYGYKYHEASRQSWGTMMIDDITDGVRWTIAQGMSDSSRLCIYGGSYGGYAALMSAVREPDLYKCVIGYVGVYDLSRLKADSDIRRSQRGRSFMNMYIGDDPKTLVDQSPINHLDKLKAPVFIVHGEKDPRAPFNQAEMLRRALEKRGHKYEWLSRSNEGHGFYIESNRVDLYNKMLDFLDRHIGNKVTATSPATK